MWKTQLTIANNFISSIDNDKDDIEIMISNEADEVIQYLFDSLKKYIKII